ncbi:MAG: ArsA family ATPase [Cyanobacteria bacterium P01_D01_bin.73]
MAFTLTFLGKGGTGRTTIAIAAAKSFAAQGKRVLLFSYTTGPDLQLLLDCELGGEAEPKTIEPNLDVVQPSKVKLLERGWGEVKALEAKYLRSPFFKDIYGEELAAFPGIDRAIALNNLRKFDDGGKYDVIVYDGTGGEDELRMLGVPDVLSWYVRRFSKVVADSDFARALTPFIQPVAGAVLNTGWGSEPWKEPMDEVEGLLAQGRDSVSNPRRLAAWLVTTTDSLAIAQAKYLWGSAQQSSVTVGGVLVNRADDGAAGVVAETFAPLTVGSLPERSPGDWSALVGAMPKFDTASQAPRPIEIDTAQKQVRLFLPGFSKAEVKLIQSGPEITIEAGGQRRNILLPPALTGRSVTGAKFQGSYLIISF